MKAFKRAESGRMLYMLAPETMADIARITPMGMMVPGENTDSPDDQNWQMDAEFLKLAEEKLPLIHDPKYCALHPPFCSCAACKHEPTLNA